MSSVASTNSLKLLLLLLLLLLLFYDHHEGQVPEQRLREDARRMAQMHGADLTEWNLARKDDWPRTLYDESFTEENPVGEYGPMLSSDGSDGSDAETLTRGADRDSQQRR